MKKEKTARGFDIYQFADHYGLKCSLQKSSGETSAIWLGIDDSKPQIICSQKNQIINEQIKSLQDFKEIESGSTGWCDYPIPDDVLIHSRMILTQEQVKALLPILKKFVKEGEI